MKWLCKFFSYNIILLHLIGCASQPQLEATVTRFHRPALETSKTSYLFQPDTEQKKSLEYERYAKIIAEHLNSLGMRQVSAPPADYGISFTYITAKSSDMIESDTRPYSASIGYGFGNYGWGGTGGYGWGIGAPLYPSRSTFKQTPLYLQKFSLRMTYLKASDTPPHFEVSVINEGTQKDFLTVSRCLIHAAFIGFPGEDSETLTVALPLNSCIHSSHASSTD